MERLVKLWKINNLFKNREQFGFPQMLFLREWCKKQLYWLLKK